MNINFITTTTNNVAAQNIGAQNIGHLNSQTKVNNNAQSSDITKTGNQGRTPVIEGAQTERIKQLESENAALQ